MSNPNDDAADVVEYLDNAPDSFITCRELGHAWDPEHRGWLVDGKGRSRQYTKRMTCLRCRMARVDTCNPRDFSVSNRRYEHPDGYLAKGVHITKYDVRRWSIEHSTVAPLQTTRRKSSRRLRAAS